MCSFRSIKIFVQNCAIWSTVRNGFLHRESFTSIIGIGNQMRSHSNVSFNSNDYSSASLTGLRGKLFKTPCCFLTPMFYATTPGTDPARGIQKDVSLLANKRTVRRKKSKDLEPRVQDFYDVIAYATAEEYNLEQLKNDIQKQGLYDIIKLPDDAMDSLYVEAKYKVDKARREIFFFREGSVVFWNIPEEEQQTVLKFVQLHQRGSYDGALMQEQLENVEYTFTVNKTGLIGGDIYLRMPQTEIDHEVQKLEMFSFSNALSLSVKLAIWEASLDKYVDSMEWVLQDLKDGKKIRMSEAEVLRHAGELFTLSHLINLSSDLLDTPDFYWDRVALEKLYMKTCKYLNIARRTRVMNEKLSQCFELTELLRDHLKDEHHTRLELMIIFLILIEVIFGIFHIFEKYYWKNDEVR